MEEGGSAEGGERAIVPVARSAIEGDLGGAGSAGDYSQEVKVMFHFPSIAQASKSIVDGRVSGGAAQEGCG